MTTTPIRPDEEPMLGRVLLGRYRVVRELARGGMGVVYLARAEGAEGFVKPVVVKLILRELASEQRYLGMFAREAKILATLRDPSIVDVIEFGEENGDYVMVLEYVRGYHLGQWKQYLRKLGREVPTDIILQLAIDVLGALHHAHNAKHPDGELMHIVHRDVSPSNILLDSDGRGRLLDFGVARMRGGGDAYKTQVKSVVGKLPYLAPELLSGDDADAKSDLYAVGVVVHETLYGKNVFRGDSDATTLYRVMHHIAEPVAGRRDDVPAGLDEVLARALAKDPADRYASAAEFQRALRALATHPEHEVRERLARLLEQDFSEDMARSLQIESLADRDEAWRRLSLLPQAEGSSGAQNSQYMGRGSMHSRVTGAPPGGHHVPRISRIPPPPPPSGMTPLSGSYSGDTPVMTDPSVQAALAQAMQAHTAQQRGAKRGNTLVLMIAVLVLIGAGGAALLMWQDGRGSQASAGSIQVVQEAVAPSVSAPPPQEPAVEDLAGEGDEGDTDPGAMEEEAPQESGQLVEAPEPRRRKPRRVRKSGPDAAALTRAFRRKSPAVQRCFESHGGHEVSEKVQVQFAIDAAGNLKRARVMPAKVASSPLGGCITKVAETTQFPAQGQPLEFAIPVMARAVPQ